MPSRRAESYRRRGQVECGFRVVDGHQDGLSERWCHGVAEFQQDGISFVGTLGGVRFLKRKPVKIAIERVDTGAARRPVGTESFAASPDAQVIRVQTATSTLEWALPPDQIEWAIEQLSAK